MEQRFAIYYWFSSWIDAYIPGASGVMIYSIVYWNVNNRRRKIKALEMVRITDSVTQQLKKKRFRASVKLLMITYIVNFLLIVPGYMIWGFGLYFDLQARYPMITATTDIMCYATMPMNPVVYAIVLPEMRSAFARIILHST